MAFFDSGIGRNVWISAAALLLMNHNAIGQAASNNWKVRNTASKELRVGVDNALPFHSIQPDGSVQGLAVDIFNEAARRRNIHLIWIPATTIKLDEALARNMVDAWPAVSRTPARDRVLHFSEPWIETEYALLSKRSTEVNPRNTSGLRLGVAASPRVSYLANKFFQNSNQVPEPDNLTTVRSVCTGEVQAGFVDARFLDSVLLERPQGCESVALRIQFIPEARNPVSIASRPEAAAIVDELRSEISHLATDGTFGAAVDKWSGFSGSQTRSYFALRESEIRTKAYFYASLGFAAIGMLLIWQVWRTLVAKRRTERSLLVAEESELRWHLALEGTNDGIWDWDARKQTVYYSPRWKEMLGYGESELPNSSAAWENLVHPEDLQSVQEAIALHLARLAPFYHAEYRIRCKDGTYKWVLARGKALWDAKGKPLRMIGSHTDITDRRGAEEKLLYQATHDPLTGLANRRHFLSTLDQVITSSGGSQTDAGVCLCLCDIDHFKGVNDQHGHASGDEVLVTFGKIICDGIRRLDLAGRMGGDEFYVLLTDVTLDQAAICVERLRNKLQSVVFGSDSGMVFSSSASFGIAKLAAGMSSGQLIEAADHALYAAKERGRNCVFPPPLEPSSPSSVPVPEGENRRKQNAERVAVLST